MKKNKKTMKSGKKMELINVRSKTFKPIINGLILFCNKYEDLLESNYKILIKKDKNGGGSSDENTRQEILFSTLQALIFMIIFCCLMCNEIIHSMREEYIKINRPLNWAEEDQREQRRIIFQRRFYYLSVLNMSIGSLVYDVDNPAFGAIPVGIVKFLYDGLTNQDFDAVGVPQLEPPRPEGYKKKSKKKKSKTKKLKTKSRARRYRYLKAIDN